MRSGIWRKACLVLLEEQYNYPNMLNFPVSVVKYFQHSLPKICQFQHELTVKIIVLIFIKFNFPIASYLLFCKDLMANVENSLGRTFTLFPKQWVVRWCGGPV